MSLIRYILGLLFIIFLLYIVIFHPLQILIYPHLPFIEFLKRGIGILILSAFFCLYRILRGPTSSDRIVGIDMLGILIVGICALFSITTKRNWYIDIGIAWVLQSFISVLALGKFLEGKDFDE